MENPVKKPGEMWKEREKEGALVENSERKGAEES